MYTAATEQHLMEKVNGVFVLTTLNIIFGVSNSSSSHTDNLKNDFLILGEGPTFILMEALVHYKKN